MVLIGDKLEGAALQVFLNHRVEAMAEFAKMVNSSFQEVWDRAKPPMGTGLQWCDVFPGANAKAEVIDLLPEDLVATTTIALEQGFLYSQIVAGENVKSITKTVPNGKLFTIYGWVNTAATNTLDAALTIVKVAKNNRTIRQWPARQAQSQLTDTALVLDPVIFRESDNIYIDLWEATARSERISWLGLKIQTMG